MVEKSKISGLSVTDLLGLLLLLGAFLGTICLVQKFEWDDVLVRVALIVVWGVVLLGYFFLLGWKSHIKAGLDLANKELDQQVILEIQKSKERGEIRDKSKE